jgi:phosphoribosylanthranilate isomerase
VTRIKVCGVTRVEDAWACADLGVDAIGLNFWAGSVRRCELREAESIVRAVGSRLRIVAVFVDPSALEVESTRQVLSDDLHVQLHGSEPPALLAAFLPNAYKALRVGEDGLADGQAILAAAARYGGDEILLDTAVQGSRGGTGRAFDWTLATPLTQSRRVWLAGGLRPETVAKAVAIARPYGLDVASGVELAPGRKDPAKIRAFVDAVRAVAEA